MAAVETRAPFIESSWQAHASCQQQQQLQLQQDHRTYAIGTAYPSAEMNNNSSSSQVFDTSTSLFTTSSGSVQSLGGSSGGAIHRRPDSPHQRPPPPRWPAPTTPDQVQQLCKKVRATHDAQLQVELCVQLMHQANQLHSSAGSSSTLELDMAVLRDALQTHTRHMLRRLARGGQAMGEMGHGEAQYLMASCLGQGSLGFRKDVFKALGWYVQAAKQNHRESNFRAGICHEYGIGLRIIDNERSVAFYRKGAKLSHAPSMYRLGVILLRGRCKQPRQPRIAVCWLQRAVSENDRLPYALHALAMVQLSGECAATSLVPDIPYALQLLHKAAQMGYEPSQSKLGEYYETGQFVDAPDDSKSIYWYTCAAEQGCPHAALGLSGWYLTGSNTPGVLPQSDRESFLWAEKAADTPLTPRDYYTGTKSVHNDVANACFVVAHYLEKGIGVPAPNQDEAFVWYRRAAALGHEQAAERLQRGKQDTSSSSSSSSDDRTRTTERKKQQCTIM